MLTHPASHIPLLASHLILERRAIDPLLATLRSVCPLVQLDDLGVIRHNSAVLDGRHDERDVHAGVVMLA